MSVRQFRLDVNEANVFVLDCPETREALLVDAGDFPSDIPQYLKENGLRLTGIFVTHSHYDHVDGLKDAASYANAPVYALQGQHGISEVQLVKHGDEVRVGSLRGTVLSTPGHTPDGISLAFPGVAFTGDALFAGSVGGTASTDAYEQQLDHIRRHIFSLPDDTRLYVGHGPPSTVAIEKKYNPFFV